MKEYIIELVHNLQEKYHTSDPMEIAKLSGIHIWLLPLHQLKGFYNINLKERYIAINENLTENDKAIVCAHELGHDVLHQYLAKYTPLRDTIICDMRLKPEREANIFAAEVQSQILCKVQTVEQNRAK